MGLCVWPPLPTPALTSSAATASAATNSFRLLIFPLLSSGTALFPGKRKLIHLLGPFEHALRLADLLPRDRARLADHDADVKQQALVEPLAQAGGNALAIGAVLGELGVYLQLWHESSAVDDDRVLAGEGGIVEQRRLDRAREDVDAPDHEHVVDTAREAGDSPMCTTALARRVDELGHVAGPVPQHRQGLLRQRRQHELAHAVRGLAALGIDDLGHEVVVEHVQGALAFAALHRHSRADHLREPVDVARVELAPGVLELLPERLGPGL